MIKVGEIYLDKRGDKMKVLSINNYQQATVEFVDYGFITKTLIRNMERGRVKNKMYPVVCGKGFVGDGKYPATVKDTETGKHSIHKYYRSWVNMMHRAYGPKSCNNSYNDVDVCEDWLNYQNFAGWCEHNYKQGYALDKDLKNIGAKTYSPDNCEFIPQELNNIIYPKSKSSNRLPVGVLKRRSAYFCSISLGSKGVWNSKQVSTPEEAHELYKIVKEAYIQKTAWLYHQAGMISDELFNSLNISSLDDLYQQEVAV